jgi:hypothetical protein
MGKGFFARAFGTGLSSQAMEPPEESPPKASIPRVSPTSPARLLAKSLTDPETRDEWERQRSEISLYCYGDRYVNVKRDLYVAVAWAAYSGRSVSTPFTLSKAEQDIVADAVSAFQRRQREEAEKAALARLIAKPRKGRAS